MNQCKLKKNSLTDIPSIKSLSNKYKKFIFSTPGAYLISLYFINVKIIRDVSIRATIKKLIKK